MSISSRLRLASVGLLMLVGCRPLASIGEPFTLHNGESIQVRDTRLAIQAIQVIDGLDGSQRIGDGSVNLRVTLDGTVTELYLETGDETEVGEYTIRLERISSDRKGTTCELVVVE